jgi:hypothetical protein
MKIDDGKDTVRSMAWDEIPKGVHDHCAEEKRGLIVEPASAATEEDGSLIIDRPGYILLGDGSGRPPGPSCGNPKGTPCPQAAFPLACEARQGG